MAASKTGNPFAAVAADMPAWEQAAHCKFCVLNCFTNAIGTYAAISRDKSPMSNGSAICRAFRYSGPAAILTKPFPGKFE
jgi:hypothetical protein